MTKSTTVARPTLIMGPRGVVAYAQFSRLIMAISSAKIRYDDEVKSNYEANCNNWVEMSTAHAQFPSEKTIISSSVVIFSNDEVDRNYEANPHNGVKRSAAHAQFPSVKMAISRLVKTNSF